MRDFHNLKVWQKAHRLVLDIYKVSAKFPQAELYSLTNQIRRAAISIGTNIAEGCGRVSIPEFSHFLQIAMGSASEVQYELILARDLDLIGNSEFQRLDNDVTEVKRMLAAFIYNLPPHHRSS